MSIMTIDNLSQAYGGFDVFMNLNARIEQDSKIGLVGPNGIGKTTLLQTLAGLMDAYSGSVNLMRGAKIGYLRQEAVLAFADTGNTLYKEMLTIFDRVFKMQATMHIIENKMADSTATDDEYQHYGELQEKAELYGLYDYDRRIERTLQGLGFEKDDWDKGLSILSGGQKTRALLAKLLLESPDLLILDEPTNHLDIEAIRWLEGALHTWKGALLIVSHDRYFLDRVVNRIWEMTSSQLDEFRGNYTAYLKQRGERRKRTQMEWDAMMERFQSEYKFIEKYSLADPNAMGRFRRITREVEAVGHHGIEALRYIKRHGWAQYTQKFERKRTPQTMRELRADMKALKSPIKRLKNMKLRLNAEDRSGDIVLRGRNLSIGYERNEPLFTSDDLDLNRGDIAALIGANGTGKTTLLKTLRAEMKPLKGHINFGANLQIGYFAQAHDELDHSNTVVEELIRHKKHMKISEGRQYLGPYLFSGDDVFKPVNALSGGERGRLALAILALKGANFLLLDEPTNHLDIPAQEVLENVLENFNGTILLVSHDRYLVDRLATQIWDLHDEHLHVFKGTYQDYLQTLALERAEAEESVRTKSKADPKKPSVDPKIVAKLEAQITSLEGEIAELETLLTHASASGNGETIAILSKQYKEQQTRLSELMVEWEDVATKVS
ncbi:MAG: ABC-F family ATP-binding cassette domain-containing protein [Anaerolineae bacterium]|nr:ABC-F family ATP-binding cassette domain-containing protein [Anaerolineae bacterium]